MSAADWIARLEAEIARELGQPVSLSLGGETPDPAHCRRDELEVAGARLTLFADPEDLAGILIEGRVIEAAQADRETVEELWGGIISSVAARLGGRMAAAKADAFAGSTEPCTLRLGGSKLRLGICLDSAAAPSAVASAPAEVVPPAPSGNFDLLLEVALDATLRFGSRSLELRELLELGPGDVVELDRHLADPVDLIVGDKIVARGEVVLVNGNFGLRVSEVAEPMRRLESIR